MARLFESAQSQYLEVAQAVFDNEGTPGKTVACLFRSEDAANGQAMFSLGDPTNNGFWLLQAGGHVAGDPVRVAKQEPGGLTGIGATTSGYSTGQWHHAVAKWDFNGSRTVYLDGGSAGTDATTIADPVISRTLIGALLDTGVLSNYFDGAIASVAVWDTALSDEEVTTLFNGGTYLDPSNVQGAALLHHWPLISDDNDVVGTAHMTPVNGPTFTDGPPGTGGGSAAGPRRGSLGLLGCGA